MVKLRAIVAIVRMAMVHWLSLLACLLAGGVFAADERVPASLPASLTPVAQVTLVAGPAERVDAQAQVIALTATTPLREGDRIRTGPGGLVHLRFIDGAHVGLRENSELKIAVYRAEPPAIEFELTHGAVRQISGAIAKRQPQSFKLNTPIAAIGVRGTDFITGYTAENSFALLLDGAIVVGVRGCGEPCPHALIDQPQTLATINAQGQITQRKLVPAEIEHIVGQQRLAQSGGAMDGAALAAAAPDKIGGQLPGDMPAGPAALVWSRWLATGRLPEDFAVEYAQIAADPDYRSRATNLSYTLWRYEPAGSSWTPGGGELSMKLDQSAARYTSGQTSLPMTVGSGTLSLNLDTRGFATRLTGALTDPAPRGMESLGGTQTLLDVSGTIDDQGRLRARTGGTSGGTSLSGIIALDKTSAGYLFSSPGIGGGKIEGITTWKR